MPKLSHTTRMLELEIVFLASSNHLLTRSLVERGSRFVQLYHTNWDSHGENLNKDFEKVCNDVDQASAALVHLLGIDHEQLTYRVQGRDFHLTEVHGKIVKEILA